MRVSYLTWQVLEPTSYVGYDEDDDNDGSILTATPSRQLRVLRPLNLTVYSTPMTSVVF